MRARSFFAAPRPLAVASVALSLGAPWGREAEAGSPAVECPADTLFGQLPDGPGGFVAGTSEASAGYQRIEDFWSVPGAIQSLTWWGLELEFVDGSTFVACDDPDPTFSITFHHDANGQPGAVAAAWELPATRSSTQLFYQDGDLMRYQVDLPEPLVLPHGWVSIVGLGDPGCWFLWLSAGPGSSMCQGCFPQQFNMNLSLCLSGPAGGIDGACCNDASAQCFPADIAECAAVSLRFAAGAACADLEPPCGTILGACCLPGAACTIGTQEECMALGGQWPGAGAPCAQCPCDPACPAGARPEGEPTCGDGYVDVFNGGCPAQLPSFEPIEVGESICGEGGSFHRLGMLMPDLDWYRIELAAAMDLSWSVTADFRPAVWIMEAGPCPGEVLASDAALECEPATASAWVEPGAYWLIVGPATFTDSLVCGARYVAVVDGHIPCPADVDGSGVVDVADLTAVVLAWGADGGTADVDGDGAVGVGDLVGVVLAFGPCP
jgi:hypothetical protein